MERIKKRLRRNNFLAGSLLIAFLLALSVAAALAAAPPAPMPAEAKPEAAPPEMQEYRYDPGERSTPSKPS